MCDGQVVSKYSTGHNQLYHRLLDLEQKQDISFVLLLRFLRSHGALLDSDMVDAIGDEFEPIFQREKMYKDVVDLRLICADIICNHGSPNVASAVEKVGHALQLARRFEDAAEIYLELVIGTFPNSSDIPDDHLRLGAALAYRYDGMLISAEREHVAVVREAGQVLRWQSDPPSDTDLFILMDFYADVDEVVESGLYCDEVHEAMQTTSYVLVGLLSIAGFQGKGCRLFNQRQSIFFQAILKSQYMSTQQAHTTVVSAFTTSSIEEYRRVLLDCVHEWFFKIPCAKAASPENRVELKKEERLLAKLSARKYLGDACASHAWCNGCRNDTSEPFYCPCRTVAYCSKACQVAHHPFHKKLCPYIKSKKTKKCTKPDTAEMHPKCT